MSVSITPRHCQTLMRDFALLHNRCNIWATPGTGKTGASYLVFLILKLLGSQFFPVLVLAPKRPAYVWAREQKKWSEFADLRVVVITGAESHEERDRRMELPADVVVVNYDIITAVERKLKSGKVSKTWGLMDYFERTKKPWPFRSVIADEATRLSGFRLRNGGKRAAALARISKHVGRWINLTGTPRPKDLLELWGQMWFIDRGERLGRTFGGFKKEFFDEDRYSYEITAKAGSLEEIARRISDVTITIKAEDYFDLPPIITNDVIVQLAPDAKALYDKMESEMFVELGPLGLEAPNAAVASMKCLQMATGAVYDAEKKVHIFDSAKLEALEDIMAEADGPVLVAYHWQFDVPRLKKRFPHAREIKSERDIDDWNAGKIDMALIHPESAGEGIDLALGGNIIVFYAQWWSARAYLQVLERLGPTRQAQHGLNRPLFVHHIISEGTLDERVVTRRNWRRDEQSAFMDLFKKE